MIGVSFFSGLLVPSTFVELPFVEPAEGRVVRDAVLFMNNTFNYSSFAWQVKVALFAGCGKIVKTNPQF